MYIMFYKSKHQSFNIRNSVRMCTVELRNFSPFNDQVQAGGIREENNVFLFKKSSVWTEEMEAVSAIL